MKEFRRQNLLLFAGRCCSGAATLSRPVGSDRDGFCDVDVTVAAKVTFDVDRCMVSDSFRDDFFVALSRRTSHSSSSPRSRSGSSLLLLLTIEVRDWKVLSLLIVGNRRREEGNAYVRFVKKGCELLLASFSFVFVSLGIEVVVFDSVMVK